MKTKVIRIALMFAVANTLLTSLANVKSGEKWSPVALGAYPIFECPDGDYDVMGFRLNLLAGRHRSVSGFDFGALVNICDESCTGFELAGICNVVGDSAWAAQFAAVCNYSHHDARGLQLALVNWSDEDFAGVQLGCFNCVGDFAGLQFGVLNSAESGGGVQFGVVNVSDEFVGVQFGLINFNLSSGVPVLPIMNILF